MKWAILVEFVWIRYFEYMSAFCLKNYMYKVADSYMYVIMYLGRCDVTYKKRENAETWFAIAFPEN
jgi:hypothetical protein